MAIVISGTPGTGKSTLSKSLAKALSYIYVDVKKLMEREGLSEGYDRKMKCKIVDIKLLNRELVKLIKADKNLVIDSHLGHYLPKRYVDSCIITTCKLKVLEQRLKKRGYPREKIRENLDAEIFEVCKIEAEDLGHNVILVDTTKRVNMPILIKRIKLPTKNKRGK